jgi:hypothetical protein
MSEILASAPPALVVVHPGSAGASSLSENASTAAIAAVIAASKPSGAVVFPAHRVEPTLHDAEPLVFEGDEVQATRVSEEVAEEMLFGADDFEPLPEGSRAIDAIAKPLDEDVLSPQPEDIHEFVAEMVASNPTPADMFAQPAAPVAEPAEAAEAPTEAADEGAPWGGDWGDFKDDTAHGDDAGIQAEPAEGERLEEVDFAGITGKAAPGAALAEGSGDGTEATEPPKKKKRKRETNLVVRFIGMAICGLLAVACVIEVASYVGVKMDFLPSWVPLLSNKTTARGPRRTNQPAPSSRGPGKPRTTGDLAGKGSAKAAAGQALGSGNARPGTGSASPAGLTSGNVPPQNSTAANASGTTPTPGNQSTANPAATTTPGQVQTVPAETKSEAIAAKPVNPVAAKPTELAMIDPSKAAAKPGTPSAAKVDDEPNPFDEGTGAKSAAKPPVKPDTTAPAKPDTTPKPDDDLFGGAPPVVAPVNEKAKPDAKPEVKPAAKPDTATPAKPDTAPKPDDDLFGGTPPAVAPVKEKAKPDAKPEVKPAAKPDTAMPGKPDTPPKPDDDLFGGAPPAVAPVKENTKPDTKPEIKPAAKPDTATPAKPDTPPKPDDDLFGGVPPAVAPVKEKSKSDVEPDLAAPVTPSMTAKPEKPNPGPIVSENAGLKPDVVPVIGPEPKPDVKPESKPEVKPEAKPAAKPAAGIGPLEAPSFPIADLDASLKSLSNVATVDTKSYADWCKLAEVVTYVGDNAESQKRALQALAERAVSNPQAVPAIAALAQKVLDDKATKGGIVLAGTVTGLATKNGLSGTAIRMEGMTKPVMIFSAHPLNAKEAQKVVVFGALVVDPAKNLPGYPGKQPVVVWSNFAIPLP